MKNLFNNIRFQILFFSLLLSVILFLWTRISYSGLTLQNIRLTQLFALTSVIYLYLSLLASPLFHSFPNLQIRPLYLKSRRALGVSAFYFGLLHGCIAF